MSEQQLFDSASTAFYEHGVEISGLDEELEVSRVKSWFNEYDISENGEVYWIDAPFIFAEVVSDGDVLEYSVIEPELNDNEEFIVDQAEEDGVIVTGELSEVAEDLESLYNGDKSNVDGFKVIGEAKQRDSKFGSLYPFFADEFVTGLTASQEDTVLISLRQPFYGQSIPTNKKLTSYGEFGEIYETLLNYTQEQMNGFYQGYYKSVQIRLATNHSGNVIQLSFYDSQSLTLPELVQQNTLNINMAAYLWLVIEEHQNLLVIGEPDGGKTTLLRSMIDFMPPHSTISAVGDGRELKQNREHLQFYSRDSFTDGGEEIKFISDMMPSYLIVDEITEADEVSAIVQAMDGGKSVWSSISSKTLDSAVKRLTSEPFSLSQEMNLFDVLVVMNKVNIYDEEDECVKTHHRVEKVGELEAQDEGFRVSEAYHRDAQRDEFVEDIDASYALEYVRNRAGLTVNEVRDELNMRQQIINALIQLSLDSEEIREVIASFYADKEGTAEIAEEIIEGERDEF